MATPFKYSCSNFLSLSSADDMAIPEEIDFLLLFHLTKVKKFIVHLKSTVWTSTSNTELILDEMLSKL